MKNAIVGSFLKSGNSVAERKRVTYLFQGSGNDLYGNLEITEVKKDDSGVYTCVAYMQSWNCGYQGISIENR